MCFLEPVGPKADAAKTLKRKARASETFLELCARVVRIRNGTHELCVVLC